MEQQHPAGDPGQDRPLEALLDELLDGWVQFVSDDGPELAQWKNRTEQQVATIMTLTAHVHRTAMILRPVLPNGLTIAHMPLVRSLYEATLTVCWTDEVADGANGLLNEGLRQRRALRQSLANTRSMREIADQISGTDLTELPTASTQQARQMQQRCDDIALDGGYAIYRMLSGLSHPSVDTIDAYVDGDSFQLGQRMSIKSNPGVLESSYAWSHLVACCLVWSGMVTNYLDKSRSRRNRLRRIARELDVQPQLAVRYDAHLRGQQNHPRRR